MSYVFHEASIATLNLRPMSIDRRLKLKRNSNDNVIILGCTVGVHEIKIKIYVHGKYTLLIS